MNIIIPYRKESLNGLELKYALRSIEKNLTGYHDIYLIGDKPTWVKNVGFIHCSEESAKSASNIHRKILAAFKHLKDERLLQWQDDIYLVKKLKVKEILYWAEGTLEDRMKTASGGYRRLIEETAFKVTMFTPYYDVHTPIIYDRDKFLGCSRVYDWNKKQLVKTTYCKFAGVMPSPYKDVKIKDVGVKIPDDMLFFTTGPQSIDTKVMELFEREFPNKSKYEA